MNNKWLFRDFRSGSNSKKGHFISIFDVVPLVARGRHPFHVTSYPIAKSHTNLLTIENSSCICHLFDVFFKTGPLQIRPLFHYCCGMTTQKTSFHSRDVYKVDNQFEVGSALANVTWAFVLNADFSFLRDFQMYSQNNCKTLNVIWK